VEFEHVAVDDTGLPGQIGGHRRAAREPVSTMQATPTQTSAFMGDAESLSSL